MNTISLELTDADKQHLNNIKFVESLWNNEWLKLLMVPKECFDE